MAKVALITGAGSGIGRAVAIALAAEGYDLALAGRRPGPLEETAALCGQASNKASAKVSIWPTDVADPKAVRALFAALKAHHGRLDLLFNNAGSTAPWAPIEDISFEDWQRVVGVNLTGAFLCAQEAVRLMKAQEPQGGRIINNGSIAAQTPRANSALYTATKHGLTGLTKSIALDGRAFDITCGQIDIGNAATPMTEGMKYGMTQADGSKAAEPVMDVADVVRGVVYMASLPPDANVLSLTVLANRMPFVGRG